jgi:hypothetical protein
MRSRAGPFFTSRDSQTSSGRHLVNRAPRDPAPIERGDDRQHAVEIAFGDLVEMVAMECERTRVERRQISQLDRGIDEAVV